MKLKIVLAVVCVIAVCTVVGTGSVLCYEYVTQRTQSMAQNVEDTEDVQPVVKEKNVLAENVAVGDYEGVTTAELPEALSNERPENFVTVNCYTNFVFSNGQDNGLVGIYNDKDCVYNLKVLTTRDEDGALMYESPLLLPDQRVANAALADNFDSGTYECTALFQFFTAETNELVYELPVSVLLTVKE